MAQRTHNFGGRLWVRIFGLVSSHPQPKSGNTIDKAEQGQRQTDMKKVCLTCHSSGWVNGHFGKSEISNAEADSMVLAATNLLSRAWEKKIADQSNPFDEAFERKGITEGRLPCHVLHS